jgi:hypothetical protein
MKQNTSGGSIVPVKRPRPAPIKKKGALTLKDARKAVKKVALSRRGTKK